MINHRQPRTGPGEHLRSCLVIIIIVQRVVCHRKCAVGEQLRKRLRVFKRVVKLARHIARNAEYPSVLDVNIHLSPKKAQIGRNGKFLVPRKLRHARGKSAVIARQIGVFVSGQHRCIPRQIIPDLEIRPGVHQIVEHIALRSLCIQVCNRRAAHGVVNQQTRIVARDRLAHLRGKPIVNAKRLRVRVHPLVPACAGIGFGILPQNDQQHLCQLLRRHIVLRAEASHAVACDDALPRAVADVAQRPGVLCVIEIDVCRRLRVFRTQNGNQLRDLFARDKIARAECSVVIARNQPQIDQHLHRADIPDSAAVGEGSALVLRAGRQRHAQQQANADQQASDSPFHTPPPFVF